jgi:hypothetical protein
LEGKEMTEEWLERQEGPDGQFCELLTRVPYDRQRMIERGIFDARSEADGQDAVLRGLLWTMSVRDTLTGEMTDDIGKAAANVIEPWRERAVELYNAWYETAMPGPKGSSRTASRTRTSGKPTKPSETSASSSSSASSSAEAP